MRSTRIYLLAMMAFVLSASVLLSQESSGGVTTQEDLIKNFIAALELQGENAIIQAMESGDVDVKVVCLEILANKGTEDEETINIVNNYITYGYYIEGLSASVALSAWKVRQAAINTAAAIKSPTSIQSLTSVVIEEPNPTVSLAAVKALGEIAAPEAAAPLLVYLFVTNSPNIVNEIVISLGKIGNTNSLPALISVVQNSTYSLTIKNNAVEAIKKLKQDDSAQ